MKVVNALAAVVLSVLLPACGRAPAVPESGGEEGTVDAGWRMLNETELGEAGKAQLERAAAARDELAGTLMAELKGELSSGGPEGAVEVCRDMAPMIAEYVADEHGVRIGRTSHRLRNASNSAPAWAAAIVAAAEAKPALFRGPTGELGVLSPIMVAAPCLACHGSVDTMSDGVVAALAESYPGDRAVGFAEGDLRGWFWVEVPEGP